MAETSNGSRSGGDARLSRLEAVVESLASTVKHLDGKLDELGRSLAASRQPNWQVLISGFGLCVILFGAGLLPLHMENSYIRERIAAVEAWQQRDRLAYERVLERLTRAEEHVPR